MHEFFAWNIFVSLFCYKRNKNKIVILRKMVGIFWNMRWPSPSVDLANFSGWSHKSPILTSSWPKIFKFQSLLPPNEGRIGQTHQYQTSFWSGWFLILVSQIFPLRTPYTKMDSYCRWVSSRPIHYFSFKLFQLEMQIL